MASIERHERRKGTVYVVRYRDPSGRQRARSFGRKADAERFSHAVESDKARGQWHDTRLAKTQFEVWAEQWFHDAVEPTKKPSTIAR